MAIETKGEHLIAKADETPSSSEVAGDLENLKGGATDLPLREGVKDQSTQLEHEHATMEPELATMGQQTEKGEGEAERKILESDGGLLGKKTQEQEAANGTEAGISVGD